MDLSFWHNRRVLVTGHTGFKGSWLCKVLINAGAKIFGFALDPPTTPSLFDLCRFEKQIRSNIGDIRNFDELKLAFGSANPEIVIHMAAQPLVIDGYKLPAYTYETNIMGTVNVLECIRQSETVKSFINVTTDKVYQNNEWAWGYREDDKLDGFDPYSNSKSCAEIVTHCYSRSFFKHGRTAVSTVRAGNVIGGGDFANDRIIPDCVRAAMVGRHVVLRNPKSVRPFQHVLEPLFAYLMIAQKQYENIDYAGCYNVGPEYADCITSKLIAHIFGTLWNNGQRPIQEVLESSEANNIPIHEAGLLKLDCSKIKHVFGWQPRWNIYDAVGKTVDWTKAWVLGEDICNEMDKQINEYLNIQEVV